MLGDGLKSTAPAELPRDLTPGRLADRLATATSALDNVELGSNEDGHIRLGNLWDASLAQDRVDPLPGLGLLAVAGKVVQSRQRVCLSATELRGHIEHGRCLNLDAREPADDLRGEPEQTLGQISSLEEAIRLGVVL